MSTTPEPPRCPRCGIYADAHERCPVTVWCPQCAAEPGDRCVKPGGRPLPIGSHGRRMREANRMVTLNQVRVRSGLGWPR